MGYMNMYEMIKTRFLEGEISSGDVVKCAVNGILSFTEAAQIISLQEKNERKGCDNGYDEK